MAKAVYICTRASLPESMMDSIYAVCERITPDHISPPIHVGGGDRCGYGIINPTETVLVEDGSILLGRLFETDQCWHRPLSNIPDGSYALFRRDESHFEAVADPAASRTIWYYKDEYQFIASTSQRAIINLLSSFEFDEQVIPWMLSTGGLGPEHSWDRRLSRIPPDSSVVLDRAKWSLTTRANSTEFRPAERPEDASRRWMRSSLDEVIASIDVDLKRWKVPLSGGYDSRAILCFLERNVGNFDQLQTVTWGRADAADREDNDAYIAQWLAETMGVDHRYFAIDEADVSFEKIVERFLVCGEGRVSRLSGYMDGFRMWKHLFDNDTQGVWRGDQGFGWFPVSSPITARLSVTCGLCDDFANLAEYQKYGLPAQRLPQYLQKRENETPATWRDRLYHQYHIPTVLAGLADLKLHYVEQTTPWLSRRLLQQVRTLPDELRTDKALFAEIVESVGPDIPFATGAAPASRSEILSRPKVVTMLQDELHSRHTRTVMPPELVDDIASGVTAAGADDENRMIHRLVHSAKQLVPQSIKNSIRDYGMQPRADENSLAFRTLLISKMTSMLAEDCRKGIEPLEVDLDADSVNEPLPPN